MALQIDQLVYLAHSEQNKSVISINPDVAEEAQAKNEDCVTFGVKDSCQIPQEYFDRVRSDSRYLWLTVDKMANSGRSIDTDLVNPLTYQCMTGSSSGGAINILKGINDFAIGTDGGGSVLAPALSCQLTSMIGAGLGLFVKSASRSTEAISITPSVGVLAKNISRVKEVMQCMAGGSLAFEHCRTLRIAIPLKGDCMLPDGVTMYEKLMPYLQADEFAGCELVECDLNGIEDRAVASEKLRKALQKADVVLTYEGPIDVFGRGETIPRMFAGTTGKQITANDGKFAVKSANICGYTGVTVPGPELAAGFVITADHGLKGASMALQVAELLEKQVVLPEAFLRYYFSNERKKPGFSAPRYPYENTLQGTPGTEIQEATV